MATEDGEEAVMTMQEVAEEQDEEENDFVDEEVEDLDFDFLSEIEFVNTELLDCPVHNAEDMRQLVTPSTHAWKDLEIDKLPTIFQIDSSKEYQWLLAKEEIFHIKKQLNEIVRQDITPTNCTEALLVHYLGPSSKIAEILQLELDLDTEMYLRFMAAFCMQSAYRVSSTELFHPESLLSEKIPIDENKYNEIWKLMAEKKKLQDSQIRSTRQGTPIWESLEGIVNTQFREVSIDGRTGRISIALDDDKIWFGSQTSGFADLFNLKFTTHVKPNRKGIIGHTAITTGANIPLGIVFERTKDKTLSCFTRMLDFLFSRDGSTDLRNVSVHSDRGYMIPSIVFEYLLSNGAEVVGTVKRMTQCWPFTYKQKIDNDKDKRTIIDVKGAPTLFLKSCKVGEKFLFASAFRNGSQSVATAVSSIHKTFMWEGIVLKNAELRKYNENNSALVSSFFEKVNLDADAGGESAEDNTESESIMNTLLQEKIVPYTLRQGKSFIIILFISFSMLLLTYHFIFQVHQIGTSFVNLA